MNVQDYYKQVRLYLHKQGIDGSDIDLFFVSACYDIEALPRECAEEWLDTIDSTIKTQQKKNNNSYGFYDTVNDILF